MLLVSVGMFALPAFASADTSSCNINSAIYGTPGNYTFTVPAGVTQLRMLAIGGGGGGGAGSGGWGSGGGGGCGGALAGGTMTVTPGQKISLYVGYGGTGGNGTSQTGAGGCPWCGTYNPSSNGSAGGNSGIGSVVAAGGSWGRTGYQNLFNQYPGGTGGGSGGGGGGNGWPGYSAVVGSGGTAGGQTNSQGAGGYCTGNGWSIDPGTYITKVSWAAGQGGQEPAVNSYYGGGGGGGLIVDNSTVNGGNAPGACSWGCPGTGGAGYGGGGGGQGLDYQGAGGVGGPGLVYIEWDGGSSNSCALSCAISFDKNPLTSGSTKIRWTSTNASLFYINNVGYVSGSGSAQISTPGDYSGTVSGIGTTASCPAVLAGNSNQCTLGSGSSGSSGSSGTPTVTYLTSGTSPSSSSMTCQSNGNLSDSCGNVTVCRYGCSTATNQCNTKNQCQRTPVCDAEGNKVVNACNGSTLDDCTARGAGWICQSAMCMLPGMNFEPFDAGAFTASGHLQAIPSLVARGASTRLYWNVTNASSCTVAGDNGDSWVEDFSGTTGKQSGSITAQTRYTLRCSALPGATPSTITESVVVNILPVFQEL